MMAKITGVEDCIRFLDAGSANGFKLARTALRDASKATSKKIRAAIPKRWRRMMRYKIKKSATDNLTALIGLYNSHKRGGTHGHSDVDDWFKAYWANYGTLQHRDLNHHFLYPIKKDIKRKNRKGQRAEHFFDNAANGWEDGFVKAFEDSLIRNEDKLYGH